MDHGRSLPGPPRFLVAGAHTRIVERMQRCERT
jgi:hypothetical protein